MFYLYIKYPSKTYIFEGFQVNNKEEATFLLNDEGYFVTELFFDNHEKAFFATVK